MTRSVFVTWKSPTTNSISLPGFRKTLAFYGNGIGGAHAMFESFYKIVEGFMVLRQICKNEQYVQITGATFDVLVDDV